MPKDLTDASSWATIAVPVGTDPALASSVETPFQLLTNRTKYLLDLLRGLRAAFYLNYQKADTTAISTFDLANVMNGCMIVEKNGDCGHTVIDNDGVTAICKHSGFATPSSWGGGVEWDEETDDPKTSGSWALGGTNVDICGQWDNTDDKRLAVSNSGTGQVEYSPDSNSWANVAGGVAGSTWTCCEAGYNGSEVWVIGGNAGIISTTTNPASVSFTSRNSFIFGKIVRIRSNRKPDSNHKFMAVDDTGDTTTSNSDGSTWTANTSPGLTSNIKSIAWDSLNDRWVGIQYNGYLAFSEDDGVTWTEDTTLPGNFIEHANNVFMLDCDDHGNVILNIHRAGNSSQIWVAPNGGEGLDNGMVWQEAYHPDLYTYGKIAFMGHSRVISAGSGGILYSDANFGTRWPAS